MTNEIEQPGVVQTPAAEPREIDLLAQEILAAREKKLAASIGAATKREILYFGDIHDCDRHNYYSMAEGDQRSKWNTFVQAKLDAGKARELSIKRELLDIGFEPMLAGEVCEIKGPGGKVLARGRTDLSLARPDSHRKVYPVEVKCMQTFMWAGINDYRDLLRNSWTRKYVRQLMLYMHSKGHEFGLFLLDDFQGHWKILVVPVDKAFVADVIGKIERASKARTSRKEPERIPYDHDLCGMCAFQNVCIPDIKRDARLKVLENETLGRHLEVRDANMDSWKKVEAANKAVKAFFDGVKDGVFTVGNFIISRKNEQRTSYDVPEEIKAKYASKKDIFKNKIERFLKPNPEEIYLEPKRALTVEEFEV